MKKEMKNNKKKKPSIKRIILFAIAIIIVLFLLLFGAKIYLYFRALTGNDLIVKVSVDKENLFMSNSESDKITINSHALANFFCRTECHSTFTDLSEGKILEKEFFSLKFPRIKNYDLIASEKGQGQKLYRYELTCNTTKSFFCETTENSKTASVLITLNYKLNEKEQDFKNNLQPEIGSILGKITYYLSNLNQFNNTLGILNLTEADDLKDKIITIGILLDYSHQYEPEILEFWNNEDYASLDSLLIDLNNSFLPAESRFNELNSSFYLITMQYNQLIGNLTQIEDKLTNLKAQNLSENSTKELNILITEFNNLTSNFLNKDSLSNKQAKVFSLENKSNSFFPDLVSQSSWKSNQTINPANFSKIIINPVNFTLFQLPKPPEKCCMNNSCMSCCGDSCYNDSEKSPIMLIHGHSFSKDASADISLNAFEKLQESLDKNNYFNAGSFILNPYNESLKGIWGKTQIPITARISYYFSLLSKVEESSIIETKTSNLDTYALRLNDIINAFKYKTNRQKVILIGHSMAGLIIRRYLQLFGDTNVQKIILIDTPNKGITKKALDYCVYFGTEDECNDMSENSSFISQLNSQSQPNSQSLQSSVPIYNIIGIGCNTGGESGDGIVKNSSQYLEGAKNYYVNGSCKESDFKYLHAEIIKIDEYPEVLEMIKRALNDSM